MVKKKIISKQSKGVERLTNFKKGLRERLNDPCDPKGDRLSG